MAGENEGLKETLFENTPLTQDFILLYNGREDRLCLSFLFLSFLSFPPPPSAASCIFWPPLSFYFFDPSLFFQ